MRKLNEGDTKQYQHLSRLPTFFDEIEMMSPGYHYVCARERRCFNLVSRFLPQHDMISTRALTLQYKRMADYYQKYHRMPKILILDDIMIHGRSIAKHLRQLEETIALELLNRGCFGDDSSYRYRLHRSFMDAVTIFVYARNNGQLFLEDGFLKNMKFVISLYSGELRDLSWQMAEKISRWEIANTSYVYSVRSKLLTDTLMKLEDKTLLPNRWVRQSWRYADEEMILYTRFHGEDKVNWIETVRFFPQRQCGVPDQEDYFSPQLTSFTIFGDLPPRDVSRILCSVQGILGREEFPVLCGLMDQSAVDQINRVLLQCQVQLISFILSVVTLFNFCKDVIPTEILPQILLRGDLHKIACNFGRRSEVLPELSRLVRTKNIRKALEAEIIPIIAERADALLNVPADAAPTEPEGKKFMNEVYLEYNRLMQSAIYRVGMNSEKRAYELSRRPFDFNPADFQEYSNPNGLYGDDGIITLQNIGKIGIRNLHDKFQKNVFRCLAAFIVLMDNSVVSVRMKSVTDNEGNVRISTLAKAGEMAAFYLPQRIALFVPAFARLEEKTFGDQKARKAAAIRFVDYIRRFVSDLNWLYAELHLYDEDDKSVIRTIIEPFRKDSARLINEIGMLYDGGQSFRGWNFTNLTSMIQFNISTPLTQNQFRACVKLQQDLIDDVNQGVMNYYIPANLQTRE